MPEQRPSPQRTAIELARRGEYDAAHDIVQQHDDVFCALIHACLHRIEGDDANAAYWYRRAGEPVASGSFEEELTALAARLG